MNWRRFIRSPRRRGRADQDDDLRAAFRIPDARGIVVLARRRHHSRAIAAERRGTQAGGMASQDGDLVAALRIPDARGLIVRRGDYPRAVAAERRAVDWLQMSLEQAVQPRGERAACQLAF